MWSRSGRELFFRVGAPPRLMRVEVHPSAASGAFSYSMPAVLLDVRRYRTSAPVATPWDISPDGERFVVAAPLRPDSEDEDDTAIISVVTGWFEELKSRVTPR